MNHEQVENIPVQKKVLPNDDNKNDSYWFDELPCNEQNKIYVFLIDAFTHYKGWNDSIHKDLQTKFKLTPKQSKEICQSVFQDFIKEVTILKFLMMLIYFLQNFSSCKDQCTWVVNLQNDKKYSVKLHKKLP